MEKLDRLGWTAGVSYEAYGTRFGIRVNDPVGLERLAGYLPLGWTATASPSVDVLYSLWVGQPARRKGIRPYSLLYAGANRLARSAGLSQLLAPFESHAQLLTAYLADGYLFVHAGVVGWQGQAIVMPGRSFSGKTTLVQALVQAGASYYSDEFMLLDRQGQVHPYPLPLSIRDESGFNAQRQPIEALGGRRGQLPLPVGLIIVTEYQAGARWRPHALSPGRALLALMANTVAARRNPEFALPLLRQVVTRAPAIKTKRGEVEKVVGPLLTCLTARAWPSPV